MRNIFDIAKLQISNLFFSPIAWLILVAIFIQCGIAYARIIEGYEASYRLNFTPSGVTNMLFAISEKRHQYPGILSDIMGSLFLYVPLLTMGLISNELSSGTLKLIGSSPVTTAQLILGKFLAMVFYTLLIIGCLGLFVLTAGLIIDQLEYGWILSGLVGIFLLTLTYMSIGLFISSFTVYQVVSALITIVVLGVFSYIGNFFQAVPVLNDVAFWLSMTGRAEEFIAGLYKSQNVAYFLVLTFLFISFTIFRLEFRKRTVVPLKQAVIYSIPILVTVLTAHFTSLPKLARYYDATMNDENTVAKSGREVLEKMDQGPLKITTFVNILDDTFTRLLPHSHNADYRRFERYRRFKPDMEMKYVYFYDSVAFLSKLSGQYPDASLEEMAKNVASSQNMDFDRVLSPDEIRKLIDLSDEDNESIRLFEYNGKRSFSRLFNSVYIWGEDGDKFAALKRLIMPSQTIGFSVGHGERSMKRIDMHDYRKYFGLKHQRKSALSNHGFDIRETELNETLADNIDILVIADPKTPLSTEELGHVKNFIDQGGNLLLAVEPENKVTGDAILSLLNIRMRPQSLLQKHEFLNHAVIFTNFDRTTKLLPSFFIQDRYIEEKRPVTMYKAAALDYDEDSEFVISPLLVFPYSGKDSLENALVLEDGREGNSQVATALTLKRPHNNREQRIIVSGDADFISATELERYGNGVNSINGRGSVEMMFHWLSNDHFPVNLQRPERVKNPIAFGPENRRLVSQLRVLLIGIFPGLILALGTGILVIRNRR